MDTTRHEHGVKSGHNKKRIQVTAIAQHTKLVDGTQQNPSPTHFRSKF